MGSINFETLNITLHVMCKSKPKILTNYPFF